MRDIFIIFIALLNFSLFLGKLVVGLLSQSIALLSDAVNSLSDTINSLVVLWATKIARKEPDESHPAGHGRAQPLAAFFVAIMTGILAFEISKEAIMKLFSPQIISHGPEAIGVLVLTMAVKGILSFFEYRIGKKQKNSALKAMSIESRGDVFISLGAIIGIVLNSYFKLAWADPLLGLFIGAYVFYTAFELAKENIDYLMGAAGRPDDIRKIQKVLKSIPEVKKFHDLRTQYLGERLQVTVHCVIKEGKYSVNEWHDLEAAIAQEIEALEIVDKALVHLDPTDDSYKPSHS